MAGASPTSSIRVWATAFGSLLALLAAWLIVAEASRPEIGYFPGTAENSQNFVPAEGSIVLAATIGWPRGDLWSAYAVAENASRIARLETGNASLAATGTDRLASAAVGVAPYDARIWLVLAMQEKDRARAQRDLKMSYYTSPINMALFPLRIRLASRFQEPLDNELGNLVEFELAIALKQGAASRNTIAVAYNTASSSGRQVLERLLKRLDPEHAAQMMRN